jgi:integrase
MKSVISSKKDDPSAKQKCELAPHSRNRERLSAVAVRNLVKPGFHHDGAGLYLQVSPSGSKSWVFRYTLDKKPHMMGLGSYPDWSLVEARERARGCRQHLDDGIDPIIQRNNEKHQRKVAQAQAAKNSRTFKECAHEFHEANKDSWRNKKHRAQYINTLTTYAFPYFGKLPLNQVNKDHIRTALLPIWKSKAATATRVLGRVREVINYGASLGYCDGLDSEQWEQLKTSLPKNAKTLEKDHHAACPHPQVGAVMKAVRGGHSSDSVKLAFQFTVLTAARSGEIRGAVWEEIDGINRIWRIPKDRMKAARPHNVPLSKAAWEVLEQAQLLQPERLVAKLQPTGLIFPNTLGTPLSDMTFTQLLRRMKLTHTMHGFRASFRTWGADIADYEHEVLEFALAHIVGDATVRAYQRSDMLDKRHQLMQDWADYVKSLEHEPLVQDLGSHKKKK